MIQISVEQYIPDFLLTLQSDNSAVGLEALTVFWFIL